MTRLLDDEDYFGFSFRLPSPASLQSDTQPETPTTLCTPQRVHRVTADEPGPDRKRKLWMTPDYGIGMSSRTVHVLSHALMPEKILNRVPPAYIGGPELSTENRELLQHYRTHVCEMMMPTSAPTMNTYLRLYLPLAVQARNSPAKQALSHAILAVAALNKAQLTPSHRQLYRDQVREHHEQATSMIKKIISAKQTTCQSTEEPDESKHALLTAAITLTTIEVSLYRE
ncbi:hypothetical protein AYO20_11709 [Fonsecaea nubica]|uniref:Transcription factor domain-containing protein n=1 Tax=Fonsecaea nubica TaxID=856822 RepID=A0A178BPK2_9EURO|nr:hypothetical protein AYO20_11709 [Fonsecaea nubica]OAL18775.1 hypothetical protein AYO20_11709 [Fonsecaea nubica]